MAGCPIKINTKKQIKNTKVLTYKKSILLQKYIVLFLYAKRLKNTQKRSFFEKLPKTPKTPQNRLFQKNSTKTLNRSRIAYNARKQHRQYLCTKKQFNALITHNRAI